MSEVDVRSEPFNGEEWGLEDIVEEVKKALDKFVKEVDGNPVDMVALKCAFLPISDGDKYFWIGSQVQD
jgi:hypothetical protein